MPMVAVLSVYFNPTMVRLKHKLNDVILIDASKFQSHNGSIKTLHSKPVSGAFLLFQSHNGSIKTQLLKTRLRTSRKFQSHNGSIKTCKTKYL